MRGFDAIVLGLGGMGSAAAAHLARRGKRVVGLEQFALAHNFGASAGRTRVIRKAYFEGLDYVPLLDRSFALWRQLESDAGVKLLDLVGTLMAGKPEGRMLDGVRACVQTYGVEIEQLDRAEIKRRFPTMHLERDEICLYEPGAGIVFPERGIAAHQATAVSHGAELRGNAHVLRWSRKPTGTLCVELADGDRFYADHLVICAGPWLAGVARDLHLPISVQRNAQVWFEPQTLGYARGEFPTFFLDRAGLPKALYGFPDLGDGVKAALHAYGDVTTPQTLDRDISQADVDIVRSALNAFIPGAAGAYRSGKACMYALTPDENFILDHHPNDRGIIIAGGFSGHGYKFCPVIGEIIADLVDDVRRPDIDFLRLGRFDTREAVS